MKDKFGSKEEMNNFVKIGYILDSFDNIEYQINEFIAFFIGREGHLDYFVENICLEIPFNIKLKIFKKLLKNEKIRNISDITGKELKFILHFSELRNIIAHSSCIEADGDFPAQAYSGKKSFNLESQEEILNIQKNSMEISKKIFSIQKKWWKRKKEMPKFKPSIEDNYFSLESLMKELND